MIIFDIKFRYRYKYLYLSRHNILQHMKSYKTNKKSLSLFL